MDVYLGIMVPPPLLPSLSPDEVEEEEEAIVVGVWSFSNHLEE